jgi:putative phosphonate metabolism protein
MTAPPHHPASTNEATRFERYALYWTPQPHSPLADFGQTWLGIDPATSEAVPHSCPGFTPAELAAMTASPRRYGLHATMKAPFRLSAPSAPQDLAARLAAFAHRSPPVSLGRLRLAREGRCLALTPAHTPPALHWLAAALVIGFDDLRAPLDASDRARRSGHQLETPQRLLMEDWGYPYVLDQFQFHVTLTSPLDDGEAARVARGLLPVVAPLLAQSITVDALALFGDPGEGQPFRLIAQYPLLGAA